MSGGHVDATDYSDVTDDGHNGHHVVDTNHAGTVGDHMDIGHVVDTEAVHVPGGHASLISQADFVPDAQATASGQQMAAHALASVGHPAENTTHANSNKPQFGCSHCGGTGTSTWPSSGTVERCWYCSGSGVGP